MSYKRALVRTKQSDPARHSRVFRDKEKEKEKEKQKEKERRYIQHLTYVKIKVASGKFINANPSIVYILIQLNTIGIR